MAVKSLGRKLRAWLTFGFLFWLKIVSKVLFPLRLQIVNDKTEWNRVRLGLLLNHTSLFEPIFAQGLPWSLLWRLSQKGVFPVADVTLKRPIAGKVYHLLAPKVVSLSRKRDEGWTEFIGQLSAKDVLLFIPEGRMKRRNGLDKEGKPMTLRAGVVEVLKQVKTGSLMLFYSEGLHHVQAPGDRFPRFFKKIGAKVEFLDIQDYLKSFEHLEDREQRKAIVADLQRRRDLYCQKNSLSLS